MDWITNPEIWVALLTLTVLEVVLGIDNIIFISILASKLPKEQQQKGRTVGLAMAMITRVLLLMSLSWMMKLEGTLFTVGENAISGRDLILIVGGLFLLVKSVREIHHKLEGEEDQHGQPVVHGFMSVVTQIALIDIVFSLDSVITAVGTVDHIGVMIAAVMIAVLLMMFAAGSIARFVDAHPTIKMLALSFLILIGVALVADGLGEKIPKGYIYFAMAFSVMVELLNMKMARVRARPIDLRGPGAKDLADGT